MYPSATSSEGTRRGAPEAEARWAISCSRAGNSVHGCNLSFPAAHTPATRPYAPRFPVPQIPPQRRSGSRPKRRVSVASGSARCPFHSPGQPPRSGPCSWSDGRGRLPPDHPSRFRPPQLAPTVGLVPVSPWRASAYAAKPRPSDSCPSPGCVAGPAHFHRSSGWSRTTLPETRSATASAYPRESYRRSAMSAVDRPRSGAPSSPSSRPFLRRRQGSESRPATEAAEDTWRTPPPRRTTCRTPESSAGNPLRRRGDGDLGSPLHLVPTRAKWIGHYVDIYLSTLRYFESLEIKTLYSGHWPIMTGEEIRDFISESRQT